MKLITTLALATFASTPAAAQSFATIAYESFAYPAGSNLGGAGGGGGWSTS